MPIFFKEQTAEIVGIVKTDFRCRFRDVHRSVRQKTVGFLKAETVHIFQRDYMAEAVRAVFAEERISGLALWQMFDARSYGSEGPDIRGKPRLQLCRRPR